MSISKIMAKLLSSCTEHKCYQFKIGMNSTKIVIHGQQRGIRNSISGQQEEDPSRRLQNRNIQHLGAEVSFQGDEQKDNDQRFDNKRHNIILHRKSKKCPVYCDMQPNSTKGNVVPQILPHHRHCYKNNDVLPMGHQHSWTTLLILLATLVSTGWCHGPPHPPGQCPSCPSFLNTPLEASTSVGAAVNMTCGIRHLEDSKVSWIRRDDLHVLTTELMTYTSDKRFRAAHVRGSPFWTLEVNNPKINDTGVYECQVSSQPKIFRRITLTVRVPVAHILGSSELFMKAGSDINITCTTTGHARPTHVAWYHSYNGSEPDDEVNSGGRGGVQLVTDRRAGTSWLLVNKATWRDAGNYTCAPEHATPAHIIVHVLHEEETAAMQPPLRRSNATSATSASQRPVAALGLVCLHLSISSLHTNAVIPLMLLVYG